jgi:PKHD-type hydroxylase
MSVLTVCDVLTRDEVGEITEQLAAGEFVDGSLTTRNAANNLKLNQELQTDETRKRLAVEVIDALNRSDTIRTHAFPNRFSYPIFSRYQEGMYYDYHTDGAILNWGHPNAVRSDLSCTVFLSEPDAYGGGELTIHSDSEPIQLKLPAGSAVIYPTSNLHRVETVTRGERLAAVLRIHSYVRDPSRRDILAKCNNLIEGLQAKERADEANLASNLMHDLLRQWAET